MPDNLAERRVANAVRTGGISAGPIYDAVLRAAAPHTRGVVLDFGAGIGEVRWVRADLNETLPLPAHSFYLSVAVEIIEHLENPRAAAREWRRLLRPGGTLVMATPNVECIRSLLALVFRGHCLPFTEPWYPAYITALTAADVQRILTEAGFQGVPIGYTDHGRIPRIATTWQQVSLGALGGRRFSDNLVAVAQAS